MVFPRLAFEREGFLVALELRTQDLPQAAQVRFRVHRPVSPEGETIRGHWPANDSLLFCVQVHFLLALKATPLGNLPLASRSGLKGHFSSLGEMLRKGLG